MAKKRDSHKFSGYSGLPEMRMSCEIIDKKSGRIMKIHDQPIQDVMQAINSKIGRFL